MKRNLIEACAPARSVHFSLQANRVGFHVEYKIKQSVEDLKVLNARICLLGSEDNHKDEVCNDSTNARMVNVKLWIMIAEIFIFDICTAKIKGDHPQSCPIRREIPIRFPEELENDHV